MPKINLEKMSMAELKALEKDVAKAIAASDKRARVDALAAAEPAPITLWPYYEDCLRPFLSATKSTSCISGSDIK